MACRGAHNESLSKRIMRETQLVHTRLPNFELVVADAVCENAKSCKALLKSPAAESIPSPCSLLFPLDEPFALCCRASWPCHHALHGRSISNRGDPASGLSFQAASGSICDPWSVTAPAVHTLSSRGTARLTIASLDDVVSLLSLSSQHKRARPLRPFHLSGRLESQQDAL